MHMKRHHVKDNLKELLKNISDFQQRLLKINKENILEQSGNKFEPKNSKAGLIDDTKSGFEKFADSIGVEIIKEDNPRPPFNPFTFWNDQYRESDEG